MPTALHVRIAVTVDIVHNKVEAAAFAIRNIENNLTTLKTNSMKRFITRISLILIVTTLFFAGCGPSVSMYDQHSYEQVTAIKVDALNVIDSSKDNISMHQKLVDNVMIELQKAHEYEIHRPKNKATAEMWALILDDNEGSFAGFIEKWKREGPQGKTYIENKKKQVAGHFDKIAEAESCKSKGK